METVTNENIYQIDWSRNDRQRFLASFHNVQADHKRKWQCAMFVVQMFQVMTLDQ